MSRRIARLLATTMAIGIVVAVSGCAAEDDIFKLRIEAKEAKGAADRAEAAAHAADSAANDSLRLANEAFNAAEAAHACCRANTERRVRAEEMMKK